MPTWPQAEDLQITQGVGEAEGMFDREGLKSGISMDGATAPAGRKGTEMEWFKGGEIGGHDWVRPRHLTMWEPWAGLNSITKARQGSMPAWARLQYLPASVRAGGGQHQTGWITVPSRMQEN